MLDFNVPYAPSQAEDGKFAAISTATLSALGMTSESLTATMGRFATLGYITNECLTKGDSIDVTLQDQTTEMIDLNFIQPLSFFSLASSTVVDSYVISAVVSHNLSAGDYVCLREGANAYQGKALTVELVNNTITLDTPLDRVYTIACTGIKGNNDMSVDGSSTPVIFKVSPKYLDPNTKWDITKIVFHIEGTGAMDDWKFGDQTALTRGIVVRKVDGVYKNIFNAKSNGDLVDFCDDPSYATKSGGGGYAFRTVKRFGGQDNSGVVMRLATITDDELQIIIQDNLTSLSSFHAVAIGHVVSD